MVPVGLHPLTLNKQLNFVGGIWSVLDRSKPKMPKNNVKFKLQSKGRSKKMLVLDGAHHKRGGGMVPDQNFW